jgi:hypothetical protein
MKLNVRPAKQIAFCTKSLGRGIGVQKRYPPTAIGIDMTELVAVLSRSLSQRDDLREIILFCAAGLLLSLVMIYCGVDLGATP